MADALDPRPNFSRKVPDGDELERVFTRTRDIRRGVIDARQAGRFIYGENGENGGDEEP